MAEETGPTFPFPPRTEPTVRIDSPEEGAAFLAAYSPPDGAWTTSSTLRVAAGGRTEDHVTLRSAGGAMMVRFDVSAFADEPSPPSVALDDLLQRAAAFARENGPSHPGELPRFPVPSTGYPGRVEVPMAILAVDRGRRGLYAPARVVVLDFPGGDAVGVGEVSGFDPERWPPPRLGDWPPEKLRGLNPNRLRGSVARFGACWPRLLGAWFGVDYPQRADEAAEARALLARLDPPGMPAVYGRLSPDYWRWLDGEQAAVWP
ncbi:MAG: hypothetical protein M3Q10_00750 [Chloroflexota bacterium]|nr:hypothetical protein [Chloroflexota bacterium]